MAPQLSGIDIDSKHFQALLKGVSKILFFQTLPSEDNITLEYLQSEVFDGSSLSQENQLNVLNSVQALVRDIALKDLSPDAITEHLDESGLSKDHTKTLIKWWTKDREKVHLAVLQSQGMGPQLTNVKWRVQKSLAFPTGAGGQEQEITSNSALLQLSLFDKGTEEDVLLELDPTMVEKLVGALHEIQTKITS
eukprot:NODE_7104_length_810_cov_24.347889_g6499_i0.p1 GENE.NODE_7104_length_810_cov_24.347889_g6499_i0~~NODE_7104_length_810_cov_24.347889_g6499_i0.p1  ORF type:complete len:212 (+),score=50.90 NODE_7104_length_810_cov_24.347889_g6499_i0:58-636(+)